MHPMYQQMIDRGFSREEVIKAGRFEDDEKVDGNKLLNPPDLGITAFGKTIIVALCGCFSPIHPGHINALSLPKNHFHKLGYDTVWGILYPAHDSYVSTKNNGTAKCSIHDRLDNIKYTIRNRLWIVVDPFPALEMPCDINFPFIVDRIQVIGDRIGADTAFVFGGDNSNFAYAFAGSKTKAVCISRYNDFELDYDKLVNVDFHLIGKEENEFYEMSSTRVRNSTGK